jgi:hypothetical protein
LAQHTTTVNWIWSALSDSEHDTESGNGKAWEPKRTRTDFRALIDEMLGQLREASKNDMWSAESRAKAEADLARIMESVRREAISDREKED